MTKTDKDLANALLKSLRVGPMTDDDIVKLLTAALAQVTLDIALAKVLGGSNNPPPSRPYRSNS